MAISVPYSLELTKLEDAIDATEGTEVDPVAGKIKIFLNASVDAAIMQSVIGSLRACYRRLMADNRGVVGSDVVAFGHHTTASANTIVINGDGAGIAAGDVAVSVSGTFSPTGETQYFSETFEQLLNVLLEKTKDM